MNNDFDKNLQDLLSNHTEQPATDCWDRILSRLDATQAVDAGSASTVNTVSQFVGSVVGKIAITAVVVASVGMTIYFVVKDNEEQTVHQQEIIATEQDTVSLHREYIKEEVIEKREEKVLFSDKITQPNGIVSADTAIENKTEETVTVVSPVINPSENQSLNAAVKESSPQSQETAQQQHHPAQPAKKETVVEPVKEKEIVDEDKAETGEGKMPLLKIPNVFTPNGDGQNDCFVIQNIELVGDNQLDIYTRDNRVVYSKRYYDNRWDGRGLPDGVYFYIFRFAYEGEQFMRTGSVTIKR